MGIETIELVLRVALVIDALGLIALIMIQQGKGASVGAAFGSGASQTMFGSAGASSFLTTLTTWLAVAFFVITFALAWAARERAETLGSIGIPELREEDTPSAFDEIPVDDTMDFGDVPELSVEVVPAPQDSEVPSADSEVSDPEVPDAGQGGAPPRS